MLTKVQRVKAMVFSPVIMYGCESWTIKKAGCKSWCFWTIVLEKTPESPLNSKEIKPINPKENQPWIFTGRTDTKAEALILWPPDAKNWLIGKDPGAGKDWRQEEKGMTEDEMVGWHHWLNGHEFEQAPGVGDGQGNMGCYSPWSCKVRHDWATEITNWREEDEDLSMPWRVGASAKAEIRKGVPRGKDQRIWALLASKQRPQKGCLGVIFRGERTECLAKC